MHSRLGGSTACASQPPFTYARSGSVNPAENIMNHVVEINEKRTHRYTALMRIGPCIVGTQI